MFTSRALGRIEHLLHQIVGYLTQGQAHVNTQIDALIAAFNDTTNSLATTQDKIKTESDLIKGELDSLRTQLAAAIAANQAPTQAQIDALTALSTRQSAISANLAAASDALNALGADPANPVPGVVVAPSTDPAPAATPAPTTTPST